MTGEAPLQSVCVCVAVRDFSLSNRTLRVRKYTTYYQIVGTYELCTCTPPPPQATQTAQHSQLEVWQAVWGQGNGCV